MNSIFKELFYVDDGTGTGGQRLSLTKAGANIQIFAGVIGGSATAYSFLQAPKVALAVGIITAALTITGKGLEAIGKRNAMK
jgi:hypothetical protein